MGCLKCQNTVSYLCRLVVSDLRAVVFPFNWNKDRAICFEYD